MQVTRLVRWKTGKTILAIGDGANDVGMLQEADIGVGISGAEGMQVCLSVYVCMYVFMWMQLCMHVYNRLICQHFIFNSYEFRISWLTLSLNLEIEI